MVVELSYVALVIWGVAHSVVAVSLLIGLLSQLNEPPLWVKLAFGLAFAGAVARAYGFWSGVKLVPNAWDLMFVTAAACVAARLALDGVMNLQRAGRSRVEA